MRAKFAAPLIVAIAGLLALGGCADAIVGPTGSPLASPRPLTSPAVLPDTPRPSPQPTQPPWPAGWDEAFCASFDEVAVAQELVVDVPRALADEDDDDALALARELRATAIAAGELLEDVMPWEPAQPALAAMVSLADIAARIGRQYVRYLDEGRQPALERVSELLDDMQPVLEEANDELAELAALGAACPPRGLTLEAP